MAPDTCKVIEKPRPTAEIEWKRIHEWYVYIDLVLTCRSFCFTVLAIQEFLPH